MLAGLFMAKAFTVSAGANDRARNIDMAVSAAVSAIDGFKAGGELKRETLYDKDWGIVRDYGEARFVMLAKTALNKSDGFYDITVTVVDRTEEDPVRRTLVDINAGFYPGADGRNSE